MNEHDAFRKMQELSKQMTKDNIKRTPTKQLITTAGAAIHNTSALATGIQLAINEINRRNTENGRDQTPIRNEDDKEMLQEWVLSCRKEISRARNELTSTLFSLNTFADYIDAK